MCSLVPPLVTWLPSGMLNWVLLRPHITNFWGLSKEPASTANRICRFSTGPEPTTVPAGPLGLLVSSMKGEASGVLQPVHLSSSIGWLRISSQSPGVTCFRYQRSEEHTSELQSLAYL